MKCSTDLVGKRIRFLREQNKLTREQLAAILDLSDSYIGLIERGTRGITLENLVKISNYFDVTLDYFVLTEEAKTSELLQSLANAVGSLDEKDFDFIISMATSLIQHFRKRKEN